MIRRIVTITAVWLIGLVVSIALSFLFPYLFSFEDVDAAMYWQLGNRLLNQIPSLVLLVMLAVEMLQRREVRGGVTGAVVALVATWLLGLPGILLYYLLPESKFIRYASLLCVSPLFELLAFYNCLPPVVTANHGSYFVTLLMSIVILVLLTKELLAVGQLYSRAARWLLPLLWIVGIHYPECSLLLCFLFAGPETRWDGLLKYAIPVAVLSLFYFVEQTVFAFWGSLFIYATAFLGGLTVLLGIYTFILMLCDFRVRALPSYGWLAVAALFLPEVMLPAVRLCQDFTIPESDEMSVRDA